MNSPVSKPRQRAPTAGTDQKREAILRAAEVLFHTQGYERTTIEQIVAALGVTKPYVYYYFHNKQEIFETLSWLPTVECFTVFDGDEDAHLPPHERAARGLERLIRATVLHYPAAFFAYREPQAFRPEFKLAQKKIANHFYDRFCELLEAGRRSGHLQFNETRITALAACSLPGFLYSWYQPDGRLPAEAMVQELTSLAWRVIGLQPASPPPSTPRSARRSS
ncbi:TetR/AcrR family transcriptional regulator [Aquabacterium sp.]|uniref:TetR/AcrR family transcriptional regulator n=1 Tax=Aquabacterium sp. TaxID=1872578 RepID=UPI002C459BEF|nr:TetR/AcrR family transcriptional regulator [Aquabacterium sp.]HSW05595.1 TetR/AcrR family transcriptional regulator [Aquabacterium sp.]